MITVCLNEGNFEYDIHSLIKAFYAGEEVKVSADREKICGLEQEHTLLFHMEILYLAGDSSGNGSGEDMQPFGRCPKDRMKMILYLPSEEWETNVSENVSRFPGADCEISCYTEKMRKTVETDFSDRKMTKDRLKQTLYRMLSEYTGQTLPWGSLTGIRPVKISMSMLEQGKIEDEVRTYMMDTYFASEQKANLSIEIAKRELELLNQIDYEEGCSLYLSIPFCPSICSYCSFSSSPIGKWKEQVDTYLDVLEREIDFAASAFAHKKLNTVYIGGGTPTTLSPRQLDRLLKKIKRSFNFSDLLEYTVEAGRPDSITREKLEVLRKHEISRISINPQTMKQETLNLIGRCHTTEQTIESFWLARELGFDNINMDLIVGLPEETLEDVRTTMEQVKRLSPDSLTVHSLAIKRAAKFKTSSEDYRGMQMTNTWEIIDLTAAYARELGLQPYYLYRQKNMAGNFENVGYARLGKAGLYNVLMMEEKQNIVALGAGSISKRVYPDGRIERCENVKDVASFIERIDEMIERKRKLFED